jgi:hypothetical protein
MMRGGKAVPGYSISLLEEALHVQGGPGVQEQLYHRKRTIARSFVRKAWTIIKNSKTYLTLILLHRKDFLSITSFLLFPLKFT